MQYNCCFYSERVFFYVWTQARRVFRTENANPKQDAKAAQTMVTARTQKGVRLHCNTTEVICV